MRQKAAGLRGVRRELSSRPESSGEAERNTRAGEEERSETAGIKREEV